jgi:hypothetical protein
MSQVCRKLVLSPFETPLCKLRQFINQLVRFTRLANYALRLHGLEVTLKSTPNDAGTKALENPDVDIGGQQEILDCFRLPVIQSMLLNQNVFPDSDLSSRFHLGKLRRESLDEELQPSGQVHILFTHALQRSIERAPIEGQDVILENKALHRRCKT